MCDYSLQAFRSRAAKVGDTLRVHNFGMGTVGFCDTNDEYLAVCVLPGTEIAFEEPILVYHDNFIGYSKWKATNTKVAIFRQLDKDVERTHHDALELPPDGRTVKVHTLKPGQRATILQLPAAPKTEAEAQEQTRVQAVG